MQNCLRSSCDAGLLKALFQPGRVGSRMPEVLWLISILLKTAENTEFGGRVHLVPGLVCGEHFL